MTHIDQAVSDFADEFVKEFCGGSETVSDILTGRILGLFDKAQLERYPCGEDITAAIKAFGSCNSTDNQGRLERVIARREADAVRRYRERAAARAWDTAPTHPTGTAG